MIRKKAFLFAGIIFLAILVLAVSLIVSEALIESDSHIKPDYLPENLLPVLQKKSLSEEDFRQIFYQTGLGQVAVNEILQNSADPVQDIISYQNSFFQDISIVCKKNSIISKQESINTAGNNNKGAQITNLKDGDILITNASHVFGWRNGHAAIVVQGKDRRTLESVVLGTNSSVQSVDDWSSYPNFMVLRLKNTSDDVRQKIAYEAHETLADIPYDFMVGLTSSKFSESNKIKGTQCSHLVWHAFMRFGFDLDSDGGRIVTPKDIANSPLLEIVQVYGVDPDDIWP
jgi:uncharacterized protein YycO